MHTTGKVLFAFCATLCALFAASSATQSSTVLLDDAIVVGTTDGTTTSFLGIPFAQPPVGNLRLQLPQPIGRHTGVINATAFGNQCIQQTLAIPTLLPDMPPDVAAFIAPMATPLAITQSEDCLNLNVIVPAGTKPGAKLPIAVWIYGGGYQVGSNAVRPGAVVVNRSIELGQPIIFVAMNYRVRFPWWPYKLRDWEIWDYKIALRWIQTHIEAFGGDPNKVIIWGQSAGSRSVNYQMITNGGDTEGLFRGAWMESGAALSNADFSSTQPTFDFMVSETGCASAADALQCLREVPAESIAAAMDKTPSFLTSLNTPWMPHADGVFLQDNPQKLIMNGSIADIPFVISACEDDGTLFSLGSLNVTTEDEMRAFLKTSFFPNASDATISELLRLYPANPAAGSPFETGDAFAFTPEYKRIAAFQTDLFYQGPRRFLLQQRAGKQLARSFMNERNKTQGLGATHTSELPNIFGGGDLTDFIIRFAHTLDPNDGTEPHWPVYDLDAPKLLELVEGDTPRTIISDTFREEQMEFLTQLALQQPI